MIKLTDEEIRFFRDQGYLIKRNVLNQDLMEKARESLWDDAPAELSRDDPTTWIGPFTETSDDRDMVYRGFTWKYRKRGHEEWMLRLLAKDPSVWTMAEQLVGKGVLQEPDRIRGIYCMMPEGDVPERPYGCHVDRHPFHLGVVGYIADVVPDGGGFTVWPGSHKRFYYAFNSQYVHDANEQLPDDVAYFNQQPHMDCHGKAGDIVFWHHRIGHSAGHNRSSNIRQAVLYDFKRKNLDDLLETKPHHDMWYDWDGIRGLEDNN